MANGDVCLSDNCCTGLDHGSSCIQSSVTGNEGGKSGGSTARCLGEEDAIDWTARQAQVAEYVSIITFILRQRNRIQCVIYSISNNFIFTTLSNHRFGSGQFDNSTKRHHLSKIRCDNPSNLRIIE